MSQRAAIKRRRQAKNGFSHLAPKQRPNYKRRLLLSVQDAVTAERMRAIREATRKAKK